MGQAYFKPESDSQLVAPKIAVKIVPTQLTWRFPAYMMSIEHRLKGSLSIEYKVGLIQDRDVFEDDITYFANKSGFKSALMIKMYADESGQIPSILNLSFGDGESSGILPFMGLELVYNEINFDRTRVFRLDCDNGCEYFQKATYGVNREDIGVRWNLGFLVSIFKSFDMEFSAAVGFLNQDYTPDDRKPTGFERMYGRYYDEDFNGIVPSFNMSIKLNYSIK